ncbi:MAG: EAL domain-containing protein, partial [Alphaproteobacteria bacterium]|nr:EAL domain-containing protein [Alphaproteobacteria bacterium]
AAVTFLQRHALADDRPTGIEAVLMRHGGRQPALGAIMQSFLHQTGAAPHEVLSVALPDELTRSDRLLGLVGSALASAGLAGRRLELVLPEPVLVDIDADGLLALSALRDRGVGLCIDGFGAGVTSLTLLRRLPLTSVKLARTLVRGLPGDREDAAIARAAIATAHTMDLTVIADGVETEHQRAFLAHCGCNEGQGPLFGPPLRVPPLPRLGLLV